MAWLGKWTKTGDSVTNSNNVTFDLYSLDVTAGDKVELGTNGQSSGCVFYTVFAVPQGTMKVVGDVNADGKLNVADLVLMQKWLLGAEKSLPDWKAGDLCEDGVLDAFDLVMMRRRLLK